ncbi:MAG: hypothetical protein Q7J51_14405 [Sheuella sp.]|nr:hypothetical protein [Sheuella sp.]
MRIHKILDEVIAQTLVKHSHSGVHVRLQTLAPEFGGESQSVV